MDLLAATIPALSLLIVANATPVILARLCRHWGDYPLDLGWVAPDGERLLGDHKTWRGLLGGVVACGALAVVLGLSVPTAMMFATISLLADAMWSAVKRRLHWRAGAERPVLDQLAESLLPMLLCADRLGLGAREIVVVCVTFTLLDIACAPARR